MNRRRDAQKSVGKRVIQPSSLNAPMSDKCRRFTADGDAFLLDFLMQKLVGQKTSSIKQLLKHRCILVQNQVVTQFDAPLTAGDEVTVLSASENRFGLNHPKLRIIFEDDYIIVVDKASGLHSVDSTGGGCENAASILERYIRRRDSSKRIYVVHRLDRDTSGVLVFAKCREAQNKLTADWNERVEERAYIAVIEGNLPALSGTVDSYLYEDSRKIVHSCDDPSRGLRAVTHYRVLSQNACWSLVRLDLETGRTNQIRVHLQSLGHPIVGDEKYGSKVNPLGRLGLHAFNIRFRHPVSDREMAFSSPEPCEFKQLLGSDLSCIMGFARRMK